VDAEPPAPVKVETVVEEHRLHPAAMLIEALGTVRRWIGLSAFPGIAALVNGEFGMRTLLLIASLAALLVVLSAVWGVLQWRATLYRVEGGAFHLKRGVLARSERSLPLERIQGVNTVQGVVQRLLGVVEVKVETAGGGGEPEVSLSALTRPEAERLREELTRARRGGAATGVGGEAEGAEEPVLLRRLTVRDLLVAGLTSGQIGVAASIVAGASQVVDDLLPGDLFERLVVSYFGETPSLAPILLFAGAILVFAWLLSIAGTVLAHAGFTLSRSADGKYLHIRRGLLSRYETTVPVARIQALRLVEGTLRQPFGLAALRVESAGFAEEGGVSTVLFPLLPRREVAGLLREAASLFDAPLEDLDPLPARARGRYAFRAALPTLLVIVPFSAFLFPWGLVSVLLAVPFALYGLVLHRSAGLGLHRDRLLVRFRRLARTTVVAPRRRLQSREYTVSPFQRRRKLATFGVRVASGSGGAGFDLTDVDLGVARELAGRLGPEDATGNPS